MWTAQKIMAELLQKNDYWNENDNLLGFDYSY